MRLFSPAKVNLFLRIIRKRPDGYHDLASLFHTVSFGDTLDLEVLPTTATKDELECNLPGVPTDESNLVIRALKLFREKSGVKRFFKMDLQKNTPAQAGMGGGSSNAAAAFFGANALCGSPASPEELIQWADDPVIGSDATFFLSQGTAYCTGRGEIVTPVGPLKDTADLAVYLVKPAYGLSTGSIFKALDYDALSTVDPDDLLSAFQEKGTDHDLWINDLEQPAFEVEPNLGELKASLESADFGFKSVLMSGSGSTIYCLGEPKGGEKSFKDAIKAKFNIEGIWRTKLLRRDSMDEWYATA
jgi:4-diphosphocytidyl-2-C-methyl-D-erythritol kinase